VALPFVLFLPIPIISPTFSFISLSLQSLPTPSLSLVPIVAFFILSLFLFIRYFIHLFPYFPLPFKPIPHLLLPSLDDVLEDSISNYDYQHRHSLTTTTINSTTMAQSHPNYNSNYMNQEFIPMSNGYLGPIGLDPMHHGMTSAPDSYQHSFSQAPAYLATTMTISQFEALHQQSQTTSQAVRLI
jgi:hypothetical protein